MISEDEDMIFLFHCFTDKFNMDNYIFTFEDLSKTGFKTKPHYHFIACSDYKQDTIRKWLSEQGFNRSLASVKEIPLKDLEIAQYYILKQQQAVFTDYPEDRLAELMEESKNYQIEQVKPKLKISWKDHVSVIIENIQTNRKLYPISRVVIIKYIFQYIFNFNQIEGNHLNQPTNMLQTIRYIESQILTQKDYIHNGICDCTHLLIERQEYDKYIFTHNKTLQIEDDYYLNSEENPDVLDNDTDTECNEL